MDPVIERNRAIPTYFILPDERERLKQALLSSIGTAANVKFQGMDFQLVQDAERKVYVSFLLMYFL